jgi:hypothetical protein
MLSAPAEHIECGVEGGDRNLQACCKFPVSSPHACRRKTSTFLTNHGLYFGIGTHTHTPMAASNENGVLILC